MTTAICYFKHAFFHCSLDCAPQMPLLSKNCI